MITVALIVTAGGVLALGALCAAYRQGRVVAERDEARCRLLEVRGGEAPPAPWTHPGKARELKRGFQPIVEPGTAPPTTAPPKPARPASSQFDSHPEARE
jgi:hypothetical protein